MEARSSYLPPKPPSRLPSLPFPSNVRSDLSKLSGSSSSSKLSVATPSSVLLGSTVSKSELSDLTGSYLNGDRSKYSPIRPGIPSHIYPSDSSISSLQRPWHQAYVLSTPTPDENVCLLPDHDRKDRIFFERCGNVEIVRNEEIQIQVTPCPRKPLVLLCMDPFRKLYEILQIWIDPEHDSVRDVLGSVKHRISEDNKWRQDYDGIIHLKESKVCQLIHCLGIHNYDVQPFEVWIAKPWSLSVTVTAHYGVSLLEHLIDTGVVTRTGTSYRLSMLAQGRIYAPDGTLNHHHAQQYLTFFPPFENCPFAPSQESASESLDDQSSLQSGEVSALGLLQEQIGDVTLQPSDHKLNAQSSSGDRNCTFKSVSKVGKYDPYVVDDDKRSDSSKTNLLRHDTILQQDTNEKWRQYAASKSRLQLQTDFNSAEEQQSMRNMVGCMSKLLCSGRGPNHLHYSKFPSNKATLDRMEEKSASSGNHSSMSSGKPSLDFGTLNIDDEEDSVASRDSSNADRSDTPLLLHHSFPVDKVFPTRKNKVTNSDSSPSKCR